MRWVISCHFHLAGFDIDRHKAWALTVLLFLCFYMLLPANFGFISILQDSFYICAVPVLVAAVLYFRRFP